MIHTPIFGRSPVQTSYDSDAVAAQVLKARRGVSCGYPYQVTVTVALQTVTRTHLIFCSAAKTAGAAAVQRSSNDGPCHSAAWACPDFGSATDGSETRSSNRAW